eukprot:gene16257-biopygen3296
MVAQGHRRQPKIMEGTVPMMNSLHALEDAEGAEWSHRATEGRGSQWKGKDFRTVKGRAYRGDSKKVRGCSEPADGSEDNEMQGEQDTEDMEGTEYAAHTEYAEDRVWLRKAAESRRRQGKAAGEHGRCWRRWQ